MTMKSAQPRSNSCRCRIGSFPSQWNVAACRSGFGGDGLLLLGQIKLRRESATEQADRAVPQTAPETLRDAVKKARPLAASSRLPAGGCLPGFLPAFRGDLVAFRAGRNPHRERGRI